MKYRVTFKRFVELNKSLMLIVGEIEADDFYVGSDGSLVFSKGPANVWAVPPTFWLSVEQIPDESVISGGN